MLLKGTETAVGKMCFSWHPKNTKNGNLSFVSATHKSPTAPGLMEIFDQFGSVFPKLQGQRSPLKCFSGFVHVICSFCGDL